MHDYLLPLLALFGLVLYLWAPAKLGPKAATAGLVTFAAALLATLLRLDAASFRLH